MCNCILWVRRRLLALLLIIGCMAVSATASATVCFLPDAEDCGLSSASDGSPVCDGVTAYATNEACEKSITLRHEAYNYNCQYCVQEGECHRRKCTYETLAECEAIKSTQYRHYTCEYDAGSDCYDLKTTPCIEKTTKTGCDGYKLDAPTEGKTCGSCSQRVVTETCSAEGLPGETDEYKTVYDCVEPKYQQIGCDSFDKTETEKDTLEAAPNNYHCTSCTKTNQKQDYEGHWNDYGKGDTMYKCTPTCATYGLVTSCSQGSGEAGTIAFVEDTKGRTNYDGKKCGTCGCTPKPCTGYDYTEDTLSDKSNNVETCNPGCNQPTKYKCKKGYKYDSATKSCKSAAVPLITIKITNKIDMKSDNIAANASGMVNVVRSITQTTSFTTTTSDNSTHKVQLRFTQIDNTESHTVTSGGGNSGNNGLISGGGNSGNNGLISGGGNANMLKAKSVANNNISNNASANKPRTITIGENEKATTYDYHTTEGLTYGYTTTNTTYSCSMTLIIDKKEVQSFAYSGVSSGCNDLRKDLATLNYNEVYTYDGYNVKFENNSEQIITKNTCATWNLKTETEANCGAGEIFKQDTTHKTDDNGDKCGTCVKDSSQCYGTAKVYLAYYNDWPNDDNVLKFVQVNDTTLQFKQGTTYKNLQYRTSTKAVTLTIDGNSWSIVDPTPGDDNSPKCYYKLLKKSTFENDTGHTVNTSGATRITKKAFYGSVYRGWNSLSSVDCAGDYVMVMACFTHHIQTINMHAYCRNYDERYGGTGTSDLQLPKQISAGFENTCYLNNKRIE